MCTFIENRDGSLSYKTLKIRKIRKEGFEPVVFKFIRNVSEEQALDVERELIRVIGRKCCCEGPLTNMAEGGLGNSGYRHTPEARRKIKENNSHFWKGKNKSERVKNKISETKKRRYRTGEILHHMIGKKANENQRRGLDRTGTKLSEEHRNKLKGRKPPNTLWWEVISIGEIFKVQGLMTICKKNNLIQSHMWSVAKGLRNHHKGWVCRKIGPEIV